MSYNNKYPPVILILTAMISVSSCDLYSSSQNVQTITSQESFDLLISSSSSAKRAVLVQFYSEA